VRHPPCRLGAGLALVAVFAVTACTPKQPVGPARRAASRSPAAPAPTSAANPAATAVQQALAAYTNALNTYVALSDSGGTDTGRLATFVSGSALPVLTDGLARQRSQGLTSKGQPGIEVPRVTEIAPAGAPTSVAVTGCLDDSHWLLYTRDGRLRDNSPGGRRRVTARIDLSAGVWKVSGIAIQGVGTCS
jgi:hypothetical protein